MSFGKRLKKIRLERGLRQEDIGKMANVGKSTVSQWENDVHIPDLETTAKIANGLNISVDYLLGRTDDPTPPQPKQQQDETTPAWWYRDTPPTDVELEEFLKTARIYFDGAPLTDEDKEDIMAYLRFKWERERKKREKERGSSLKEE